MTTSINLIHSFPNDPPSVKNIKQTLDYIEDFSVSYYSLRSPGYTRFRKLISTITLPFNTIDAIFKTKFDSDILIIHKTITPVDIPVLEQLFANFDKVVYSTYDADYVNKPQSVTYLFKNVDLVWATSHAIQQRARRITSDVSFIPPSVNTEFFSPAKERNKPYLETNEADIILGWVGNAEVHIDNLKLMADRIDGIADCNIYLRILGGGELPKKIRSILEDAVGELEDIGWVKRNKVPSIIRSFDAGLAPLINKPKYRGCSSEKIREYMACGIPVIASNVGENPYLLPSSAGYLVESSSEWKNAIRELSNNKKLRNDMGQSGRQYVRDHYSVPTVAEKAKTHLKKL